MPKADPVDIWALTDLITPWCLRVAVTLRISEHIEAGRRDVVDLAEASGCDAAYLQRVLEHLVERGVFEETAPGRFALNEAAEALLEPSMRIVLDLDGIGGRMAHAWGTLLSTVRAGAPAYGERFGLPFFEDLDAHPDLRASFDALMGEVGHGPPDPEVLIDGDWDSVSTVVDVGGGDGALLVEILRAQPHVSGTLIDLPGAVARSGGIFAEAGVADRATAIAQSFFDPLPPGRDVYILSKILNDWPQRETVAILARCADAARPSGRVVTIGGVSEQAPGGLSVEFALVGGTTTPLSEFRSLAMGAGLLVTNVGRGPGGQLIVECRPL